jgi:hypothetical protein
MYFFFSSNGHFLMPALKFKCPGIKLQLLHAKFKWHRLKVEVKQVVALSFFVRIPFGIHLQNKRRNAEM